MSQHFDEHIKNEFLDYTPQVHPRIWENIMKERDKKRPAGFWWRFANLRSILLLGGLLLLAGAGGYVLFNNSSTTNTDNSVAAGTTTADKTSVNTNPVTTGNNNGSTISEAVNNTVTDNNSNTKNDITPATTNTGAAINSTPDVTPSKNNNTHISGSNNDIDLLSDNNSNTKNYSTQAKQRIKTKNGTAGFVSDDETIAAEPANEYTLPFLFFTAQKNTAAKAESSLRKRVFPNVVDPGCPTIEKDAAGNKTYIEVYGGPDYAFRNLSDTGSSVYLQKRKESTKFSSAFSVGIRYTKVFNNGVSIRTGINYSQINEKFTYSEGNIVQVVYIINANGDTIGSYTNTGSRYKTTHNKFRTIDVPIVLGYELGNGRLHTNINAGVIINAYSWQKGEVLDGNLKPVNITTGKTNSPYQFKTNIGVGFIGSVSLYYKLNEKLHLMAEPYFRYNLTPASKENITFKQKYNTAGLRLGLRLDLH